MVFACELMDLCRGTQELMDLCRGTQEVEAVLSEGGENGSPDPLARLKMAMEYEEKKVSADQLSRHLASRPRAETWSWVHFRDPTYPSFCQPNPFNYPLTFEQS